MDAKAVVGELKQKGIVPQSCQEKVAKADGFRLRNEILHDCLKRTCTREAFIKACDIIIELAEEEGEENNPKMKKVGEDMKMKLGTGKTICALSICVCSMHVLIHFTATCAHTYACMVVLYMHACSIYSMPIYYVFLYVHMPMNRVQITS